MTKRRADIIFAKLDPGFLSNRKILRAGRNGRDVYIHVLCQNAARGGHGWIPAEDLEPWYVARQLGLSEEDAVDGIQRACNAGLVTCNDDVVTICGWDDEWARRPLTSAERQDKFRSKTKGVTEPALHVTEKIRVTDQRDQRDQREPRVTRQSSLSGSSDSDQGHSQPPGHDHAAAPAATRAAAATKAAAANAADSRAVDVATWTPPLALLELARSIGCDPQHELTNFRLYARQRRNVFRTQDAAEAAFEKFCRNSRDKGRKPDKPLVAKDRPRRVRLLDGTVVEREP